MPKSEVLIRAWLEEAQHYRASHLIVLWDGFAGEETPVYVRPGQQVEEMAKAYGFDRRLGRHQIADANMQTVIEIYSLALPLEAQLAEEQAMHIDD